MFTDLQIPAGRRPLTRGEAISAGIFLALFFGIVLFGLAQNFKPANACFFFMILFWGPMLVLHELGHAIACWILGWRVGEISIGFGPQIFFKRWGGTDVRVRLIPLEGFVRPAPRSTTWARTKSTLIFAAGPGIEFLLLAVLIVVLGWDGVFNSKDDYFSIAIKSLAIVIIFGGGLQLIPFPAGGGVSDGLGMITSAFLKDADLRDHRFSLEFQEVKHLLCSNQEGALASAEQIVSKLKEQDSGSFRIAYMDTKIDLAFGRHDDCLRKTKELVQGQKNGEHKVELLFQILLSELDRDPPGYEEAELAVKSMNEMLPDNATCNVASGMLAVRKGQYRKGGKILSDVFQSSQNRELDPIILAYLAVASTRVGDHIAARRFLDAFKSYRSPKYLKAQLARLIRD